MTDYGPLPIYFMADEGAWVVHLPDGLTPNEIVARVRAKWALDSGYPIPLFTMTCLCGSREWRVKHYLFHKRGKGYHRLPYRVDAVFKCLHCGFIATFGIPVTELWWKEHGHTEGRRNWRDVERATND